MHVSRSSLFCTLFIGLHLGGRQEFQLSLLSEDILEAKFPLSPFSHITYLSPALIHSHLEWITSLLLHHIYSKTADELPLLLSASLGAHQKAEKDAFSGDLSASQTPEQTMLVGHGHPGRPFAKYTKFTSLY